MKIIIELRFKILLKFINKNYTQKKADVLNTKMTNQPKKLKKNEKDKRNMFKIFLRNPSLI